MDALATFAIAFATVTLVLILIGPKMVRQELAIIESERAAKQRAAIDADVAAAKGRS
jgi:hypothetical protein